MNAHFDFSASAERVLQRAYVLRPSLHNDQLAVLLAILDEEECPGARRLESAGITKWEVQQSWGLSLPLPLVEARSSQRLDFQQQIAVALALFDPRRLHTEITTEHLLLALAAAEDEVGQFLSHFGLSISFLAAEQQNLDAFDNRWQAAGRDVTWAYSQENDATRKPVDDWHAAEGGEPLGEVIDVGALLGDGFAGGDSTLLPPHSDLFTAASQPKPAKQQADTPRRTIQSSLFLSNEMQQLSTPSPLQSLADADHAQKDRPTTETLGASGTPSPSGSPIQPPQSWVAAAHETSATVQPAAALTASHSTLMQTEARLWRILDASLNRASEGLRVLEDYARFVLDDASLTLQCKQMRQQFQIAEDAVSPRHRLMHRDIRGDVGAPITSASEAVRQNLESVALANVKRCQQALRSLEEFSKLLSAELGGIFKQLRYQAYALESHLLGMQDSVGASGASEPGNEDIPPASKSIAPASVGIPFAIEKTPIANENIAASSVRCASNQSASTAAIQRRQLPRLYVLLHGLENERRFADVASAVLKGGAGIVQLRDKKLDDRALVARAQILVELTEQFGAICIVNDRPDLALEAGAHGVHVGQEEVAVETCRGILGPQALIGLSTHSTFQVELACERPIDYLGVGPTYASKTKNFATGGESVQRLAGPDLVAAAVKRCELPVFAIGGITLANAGPLLACGVHGVAVSSAIVNASDPEKAAASFAQLLHQFPAHV